MVHIEKFSGAKEQPMFQEALQREVVGIAQREASYYNGAQTADLVLVVTGCDDSRQGIPQGVQEVVWAGRRQRVLFDFVPVIGGGVARDVLPDVIDRFVEHGIDVGKIAVLTTQHGNSAEVQGALDGVSSDSPTCGLRGVLKKMETGVAVHVHEPLLKHAGSINNSSKIIDNGNYVYEETKLLLKDYGVRVLSGYFDHEGSDLDGKSIAVIEGAEQPFSFSIPDQEAWHERHQDPEALVVSFGKRAASLPDGVILPETVGDGANNDFNSAGTDAASFENAMREQWYALSHVGGHGEDLNFKNTSLMVLLCDGDEEVNHAKSFMASDEFTHDFLPFIQKLRDKGVYLVNLAVESVELHRV